VASDAVERFINACDAGGLRWEIDGTRGTARASARDRGGVAFKVIAIGQSIYEACAKAADELGAVDGDQ
jgi:hypothetical protein